MVQGVCVSLGGGVGRGATTALSLFNRPDVARADLQTSLCLIHSLSHPLCIIFRTLSIPNHRSWEAETLKECPPPPLYVSHVTCQVSCVTCHFFLNEQTGGASWGRVCYQRGLPRLVSRVFSLALMMQLSPSWGSSRFIRPTLLLLLGQWWCQVSPLA